MPSQILDGEGESLNTYEERVDRIFYSQMEIKSFIMEEKYDKMITSGRIENDLWYDPSGWREGAEKQIDMKGGRLN